MLSALRSLSVGRRPLTGCTWVSLLSEDVKGVPVVVFGEVLGVGCSPAASGRGALPAVGMGAADLPVVRRPLAVSAGASHAIGFWCIGCITKLPCAPLWYSATIRSIASSGVSPGRCPTRANAGEVGAECAIVAIELSWCLLLTGE